MSPSTRKIDCFNLTEMKKKWFFPFIAVFLLSLCFICADKNDADREQEIRLGVTDSSALVIPNDNVSSTENVTTANQTITLKNPNFQEMKDFILKDHTSRKQFVLNKFECRHFASEVDNNAEAAGLRCGFVLLCYDQGQHAVVAFDTTDRGLIFIEPQTDAAIDVRVGGQYQGQKIKEILIAW